jgi:pimeloyl-ACP methyl ester carboxylesterase
MQTIIGYRDGTAQVRGLDIHYLEWGEAGSPPMVLLHGLTGHAHTWDHMAPGLSDSYHVFAPDQRGHGDSAAAATYATQDFVDDLGALVRAWGVSRFVLMGLSMGGHNAMAYAASHPEQVERLIVIDIPPRMDRAQAPNWEVISRLAETGHRRYASADEALVDARAGNPTAPEENLRYRTEWNLRRLDDGALQLKYDPKAPARWDPADLWERLPAIKTPTLLVRGGKTLVLPSEVAAEMVGAFPDADFVEVLDSGHSVPTDCPEALTAIVLDWLRRRA